MDTNTLLAILSVAVLIFISLVIWARKGGKLRWWLGKAGAELQSPPQALPHRPEQTQIRTTRSGQKMVGSSGGKQYQEDTDNSYQEIS